MGKNLFAFRVVSIILLLAASSLWAQNSSRSNVQDDAVHFVGLKLDELIARFGSPQTVYVARGKEVWQDDVVFVYPEGEFALHKDRVWQVALKSACGVVVGDTKSAVLLALGKEVVDRGDHILSTISAGTVWPMMLRVNLNASGKVQSVYIYRADY